MECEIGSKAFIIESNRIIQEVTIVRKNSDFVPLHRRRRVLDRFLAVPQKRLQKSILQRTDIFLRHPGDGHHISIGIKK